MCAHTPSLPGTHRHRPAPGSADHRTHRDRSAPDITDKHNNQRTTDQKVGGSSPSERTKHALTCMFTFSQAPEPSDLLSDGPSARHRRRVWSVTSADGTALIGIVRHQQRFLIFMRFACARGVRERPGRAPLLWRFWPLSDESWPAHVSRAASASGRAWGALQDLEALPPARPARSIGRRRWTRWTVGGVFTSQVVQCCRSPAMFRCPVPPRT